MVGGKYGVKLGKYEQIYLLPPFHQSYYIIFLHPVLKKTCTHFTYTYLLGAS